jgi:hypothetical protein
MLTNVLVMLAFSQGASYVNQGVICIILCSNYLDPCSSYARKGMLTFVQVLLANVLVMLSKVLIMLVKV